MRDPVNEAIKAAEGGSQQFQMRQFQVRISSTGRPFIMALPADATDGEIAEAAGWMLTEVLVTYRQERMKPRSKIALARTLPPRPQ